MKFIVTFVFLSFVVLVSTYIIDEAPFQDDEIKELNGKNSSESEEDEKVIIDKRSDDEMFIAAESDNEYVYKPLFTYRRIEHTKRRINMYNAFAG